MASRRLEESGVAMPADRRAQGGQGREPIEQAPPYQFGARTRFAFEEDGLHCTMSESRAEGAGHE